MSHKGWDVAPKFSNVRLRAEVISTTTALRLDCARGVTARYAADSRSPWSWTAVT